MARHSNSLLPTRRSLISRLKDWEDQRSWKEFFDTYGKLIYAVSVHRGLTDAEAQEVVQETVIGVAKNIRAFQYDPGVGSFKAWLLTMAHWRIEDQRRKRQRDAARLKRGNQTGTGTAAIDRVPDPAGGELDAIFDLEWEKTVFAAALKRVKQQVNPKHYQVFDLYVVKQWPAQKVADTLQISTGQIFLIKHRVLALVKAEIRRLEAQGI